jgi:hypothetical protein
MLDRIGEHDLKALFANRVASTTIINWRAGRRAMPAWAINLVRERWQQLELEARADLAQMKAGSGRKAGTRNIMAWNARR